MKRIFIIFITVLFTSSVAVAVFAGGHRKVDPFDSRAITNTINDKYGPFSKPREEEKPFKHRTYEETKRKYKNIPVKPFYEDGHIGGKFERDF